MATRYFEKGHLGDEEILFRDAAAQEELTSQSAKDTAHDAAIGYQILGSQPETQGMISTIGTVDEPGVWTHIEENYTHIIIPISSGDDISITAQSDLSAYYTLLKSYTAPVQDALPDYATGYYTALTISQGQTVTVTAPSDATYLYLAVYRNTGGYKWPQSLIINGVDTAISLADNIRAIPQCNVRYVDGTGLQYFDGTTWQDISLG